MAAFVTEEEDCIAFIIKCECEDVSTFSEGRFGMKDENGESSQLWLHLSQKRKIMANLMN